MTRTPMNITLAVAAMAAGIAISSLAFAAGTTPSTSSSPSTPKCSDFAVNSAKWKKCMKTSMNDLNNEEKYAAGYALAKAGDYAGALDFLNAGTDKKDVRFLTMIGYSTRKMGKVDEGMGFYMQALALDPNSVTTREYLGEAYLQKKDLPNAQAQLDEIKGRCGTTCESFTELNSEIKKYQASL